MARPPKIDKEELALWRQRIRDAELYLNYDGRVEEWHEIREYYKGRLPKHSIKLNMLFAVGRAMIPQIYYKNPTISAEPAPGVKDIAMARQKAKVLSAVDDMIIRQNHLKGQFKLGILDCYRFNIFVMKHGYSTISTELPETAQGENPESASVHPMVEDLLGQLGFPSQESDAELDPMLLKHSYHDLIFKDSPWSLRVPPEDFLVPWGARNIHEAPWCAFRIRRPIDDVKADPNYDTKITKAMKGNWGPGMLNRVGDQLTLPLGGRDVYLPTQFRPDQAKAEEWLVFYEIWDKRTGRVMAFALDEGNDFMRREEHNLPISLPVSIMQFNEEGEDFWGPSDAAQILPLVKERNETRSIEFEHKKMMLLKLLLRRDSVNAEERLKLNSGQVGPVILTDGPPAEAAMQLTPQMSRDIFQIDEVNRRDIQEIIGFSRNQMAEFEADRRTATEANIVQQNLLLRGDERRDLMGDFIGDCFQEKINPLVFAFWKTLRYAQVLGIELPVPYTGASLQGRYEIRIAADSTIPVSEQMAKEEAVMLFKIGKGDPNFNQAELYKYLLDQFRSAPVERLLIDPATAAQQQLQMLLAMGQGAQQMGGASAKAGQATMGSQGLAQLMNRGMGVQGGGGNGAV